MVKENLKYENSVKTPPGAGFGEETSPFVHEEPVQEVPKNKRSKGMTWARKSRKAIQEFLGGDYLNKETVTGNIGYILFLGFLAMVYISNTYYTEKIHKTIDRTKNELKELRYQFITTKSMLMFQGRQSEISIKALEMGLKESKMPPYKIQYSGESLTEAANKK